MPVPTITHIIQDLGLGGAESFVVDLAEAQRELGVDVDVLLVGRMKVERNGMTVPVTAIKRRGRFDVAAIDQVRRHLRRRQTGVAHLHTAPGLVYGMLGSKLARTRRVVFTEHASSSPKSHYGKQKSMLDILARQADSVVTFDESLRNSLVDTSRLPRERISVIPNGVPINRTPRTDRTWARQRLEAPEHCLLVVATGGLRPEKNYQLLVDVASVVREVRIDGAVIPVEFRIIGEGPERASIERQIALTEVTNVKLLGQIRDARSLLPGADAFLNTSSWEGMPIAILEAMVESVPVVATRTGSVEALLSSTGIIVELSRQSIADKLKELLESPALRASQSQRASDRALTHFNITTIAQKYQDLYLSLD